MNKIFEALRPVIRLVVRRPEPVCAAGVLISVLCVMVASNLRVDTDFSKLIPKHYESVKALERLRETVGAESEIAIGIVSDSFEANRSYAETLIPQALALEDPVTGEPFLSRVEYRRDTEFLENNALYFATTEELDRLQTYLEDRIEEAKLEANPFFFELEEEDEEEPDTTGQYLQDLYEDVIGKEYPISDDSTTLVLRFYPAGSQTDLGYIDRAFKGLEELVGDIGPETFDPGMSTVVAGRLQRQLVEVRAVTNNIINTLGLGISVVLLTVVLYFVYKEYMARTGGRFSKRALASALTRIPVMALVIGLPLIMSLTWTGSIAYAAFETLNLMTATLGLVLFGLGIDYGIHYYARYSEERAHGRPSVEAAEVTFVSTGQAVTVGALTTAAALYVLMVADFRGFSEFGFIAGTGILFALVAMLIVMPALIVLLEKWRLLRFEGESGEVVTARRTVERFPRPRMIVLMSSLAILAAVALFPPKFEYQFGKLEPEFTEYEARRAIIRRVYSDSKRRNPAYVVADRPDEIPAIAAAIRAKAAADTLSPTIRRVESLQDRFPMSEEAQQEKLARIAEVRTLLDDPFLTVESSDDLDKLKRAAQTDQPIALTDVPEFLRKQFMSKSGELGSFVAIYPSVGLSDGRMSMAFSDDIGTIVTADSTVYHAGSTSLIAADMLRLMQKESPWFVAVTFLIVVLLMRVNFGSWKWAVLASLPLVVGVLWMILIMEVSDMRLNFYNLIVLPAVLGIGNDAGVHIVHRYLEEGARSLRFVLRSTGEHITMGSLTTMMGFAGPLLSFHPGLQSIGALAVVGIGTTLLSAVLFLPALLQMMEDATVVADESASVST